MIQHSNSQNNLSNKTLSFFDSNQAKTPYFNVSYRTQDQIDRIESFRHPLLEHHRTRKKSASFALLKLICGRHLHGKWGRCQTNQINLGKELYLYEHNKSVGERQIRRLITNLKKEGLISYIGLNSKFKEVKVAIPTSLGMDVYRYIILNNRSQVRLAKMQSTPKTPINAIVSNELVTTPKENVRQDMVFCLKKHSDPDHENTRMNESKIDRKIDLKAAPMSYEELQGAHLHVNVPYPEKNEPKASGFFPKAANEPKLQRTQKPKEDMRLSTIRKNDTMLPHAVFQMLDKTFRDEQYNIVCKLLLMINACQATKISLIECVKGAMVRKYLKGERVLNFGAFANSIMRKYLERLAVYDVQQEIENQDDTVDIL